MRHLLTTLFAAFFPAMLFGCTGGPPAVVDEPEIAESTEPVDVTVRVYGVTEPTGTINVGLYTGPDTWLTPGYTYAKTVSVGAAGEVVVAVLPDVPPGVYAISLYQDVDGDGDMSRDAFGIPSEPWGMSNDAQGVLGPPSFEAASIRVRGQQPTFDVNLRRGLGITFGDPGPGPDDT